MRPSTTSLPHLLPGPVGLSGPTLRGRLTRTLIWSGLGVVTLCFGLSAWDLLRTEAARAREEVEQSARWIGAANQWSLLFNESEAAARSLGALRTQPRVLRAFLFDAQQAYFAGYVRAGLRTSHLPPLSAPSAGSYTVGEVRVLTVEIREAGELLGYLTVETEAGLPAGWAASLLPRAAFLILFAAAIGAALLRAVDRGFTRPVRRLVDDVEQRVREGEITVPLPAPPEQELGRLVWAINELVGTIQARDTSLAQANSLLEARVAARTRDLEKLRTEALAAAEEARLSSDAKSLFLANVSHEIRTPLNGVIGMASLLADMGLDPAKRELVQIIRSSGETLLALINDILDFSKIESGQLTLESVPFDVEVVLEETLALFGAQAQAKGIGLLLDLPPDLPRQWRGDPTRWRQIVSNLVSNAIKFTSVGEVVVRCRTHDGPGARRLLRLEVQDTGIGIAPEAMGRLFRSFSQAESSTSRRFGGTGLGLAICKRISELMGGRLTVESEVGRGSTFICELPLDPISASAPAARPRLSGSAGVVLPSVAGRRILQRELEGWGLQVAAGSVVPELLERFRVHGWPNVILVDHNPPAFNGHLAAETFAQEAGAYRPVIACLVPTGQTLPIESSQVQVEVLPRQWRRGDLHGALSRLLAEQGRGPAASAALPPGAVGTAPAPRPAALTELQILLVEDNPINRRVALLMLERLGFTAEVAHNGAEGLAAARRRPFDLILMDLEMPELNGWDAAREMRRDPAVGRPYLVAVTAAALAESRTEAFAAGFDEFLTKPLDALEVKRVVEKVAARTPREVVGALDSP